jgi:hypothetical protein
MVALLPPPVANPIETAPLYTFQCLMPKSIQDLKQYRWDSNHTSLGILKLIRLEATRKLVPT